MRGFIAEAKPNPEFIHLHDTEAFDRHVDGLLSEHDTYREAYQKAEQQFKSTFGETKYSSYESYRVARFRREKRRIEEEM